MICLMSNFDKTVQNITREIIKIMSLYEFPQIPFMAKGYHERYIRKFELLKSKIYDLQVSIELWYMDRKHQRWILIDGLFSQRILSNLKKFKIMNFPLISLSSKIKLSQTYYETLLESYIKFKLF